jgi:aerobic C4-dicarboxylate transport protein
MKRLSSSLYVQVRIAIVLGVLLVTSKGAAGVTGSGFIVLAATGKVPVTGMARILGVDRFMSEARAIPNFIANTVATLILAKWNGEFDRTKAGVILSDPPPPAGQLFEAPQRGE